VAGLWAAAGAGVVAGVDGVDKMTTANDIQKRALRRHDDELGLLQTVEAATGEVAESYGRYQFAVQRDTLGRFARWLEANQRKVNRLDRTCVDGVEVIVPELSPLKFQVAQAENLLAGGMSATLAAFAARQAALTGVRVLATAGTGAAISGLSGAAAESAILAWLGGGTLAAGGGGMAAGATMLSVIGFAPALLIGGLTLSSEGNKALTQARKIDADVNLAIAGMQAAADLLDRVETRIDEVRSVLEGIDTRAQRALESLESLDFDPDQHGRELLTVLQLVRAIGEVLSTPILDEAGDLTTDSVRIVEKYA
jgi:hypothetical protein